MPIQKAVFVSKIPLREVVIIVLYQHPVPRSLQTRHI